MPPLPSSKITTAGAGISSSHLRDKEGCGFVVEVFAPNRKNSSCQEMVGQYLRWYSIGNLWGSGLRVTGYGFAGCGLRVAGCGLRIIGATTHWDDSETNEEVKGNRLVLRRSPCFPIMKVENPGANSWVDLMCSPGQRHLMMNISISLNKLLRAWV